MVRRRIPTLSKTHPRKKIRRSGHLPRPRTSRLSAPRRNPHPRTRTTHPPPRPNRPRILPLPRRPLPRRSPPRQAQPPNLLLLIHVGAALGRLAFHPEPPTPLPDVA